MVVPDNHIALGITAALPESLRLEYTRHKESTVSHSIFGHLPREQFPLFTSKRGWCSPEIFLDRRVCRIELPAFHESRAGYVVPVVVLEKIGEPSVGEDHVRVNKTDVVGSRTHTRPIPAAVDPFEIVLIGVRIGVDVFGKQVINQFRGGVISDNAACYRPVSVIVLYRVGYLGCNQPEILDRFIYHRDDFNVLVQ